MDDEGFVFEHGSKPVVKHEETEQQKYRRAAAQRVLNTEDGQHLFAYLQERFYRPAVWRRGKTIEDCAHQQAHNDLMIELIKIREGK